MATKIDLIRDVELELERAARVVRVLLTVVEGLASVEFEKRNLFQNLALTIPINLMACSHFSGLVKYFVNTSAACASV